jgi:hypothetical protein
MSSTLIDARSLGSCSEEVDIVCSHLDIEYSFRLPLLEVRGIYVVLVGSPAPASIRLIEAEEHNWDGGRFIEVIGCKEASW